LINDEVRDGGSHSGAVLSGAESASDGSEIASRNNARCSKAVTENLENPVRNPRRLKHPAIHCVQIQV
jgi:hypothetical protein